MSRRQRPDTEVAKSIPSPVTGDLLAWYDRHRRALPWRALPGIAADPYAVWLSEIMLQQTTVAAVKPYFAKFLATWPTVDALAVAELDEVMRAWAGLGYYSRARNLHLCAQVVAREHGGRFPATETALRTLPGIGAYTAAAIAAIAFGAPAVVVDGNVERVVTRLHSIATPLPAAKPAIYAAMAALTPPKRAGDFAQSMMDLGATICTPKSPACAICPLLRHCSAARAGQPTLFPVKAPKRARPTRFGLAYVIRNPDGALLLRTRPAKGLLGSMAELPGSSWDLSEAQVEGPVLGRVEHGFTHFTLMLDVVERSPGSWTAMLAEFGETIRWVPPAIVLNEALPTLMRRAIEIGLSRPDRLTPVASPKRRRS